MLSKMRAYEQKKKIIDCCEDTVEWNTILVDYKEHNFRSIMVSIGSDFLMHITFFPNILCI